MKERVFILPKETSFSIKENFKGEVSDKEVKFPKSLGAMHPFEFEDAEELYKKFGLVSGIVDKITNSITTDFKIDFKNKNAQAIIDSFLRNNNFKNKIRDWVREAVLKGNGFMEIDLKKLKVRVMNSNNMYVRRNKKSKVLGYNQYTGELEKFNKNSTKLIPFKKNEIAHIRFNKIPNDPYGIGFIYPNEKTLTNLTSNEDNVHTLIKRKAGAPYHIKVGQPGEKMSPNTAEAIRTDLQYLTNKTEWVTDGNAEIKMLDAPGLGENHLELINHDFRMFLAGTNVPEVLMGSGQLNEGIAKTQLEGYTRFIKSLQLLVEEVIKEKIIKPILNMNKLDEDPLFTWDLPGEEEINKRITSLKELLTSKVNLSPEMKARIEQELADLLGFEDMENILISPKDAKKKAEEERAKLEKRLADQENKPNPKEPNPERQKEEDIPQPEVPGAKPAAKQSKNIPIKESDMSIKEWINLQEIDGFNYLDYVASILLLLQKDKFDLLQAKNEADVANGLLTAKETEKLRIILKDGFKNNRTISELGKEIDKNINLKDRLKDGKVTLAANLRANAIARSETVRLANMGLVNLFRENGVEKVRFLAALSDRTCKVCESLNGKVFLLNELNIGDSQPPIHAMCRCSLISVIE